VKKTRIIAALFLALSLLCGCSKPGELPGSESSNNVTPEADNTSGVETVFTGTDDIHLVTDGKAGYVIILKDSLCENAANQFIGTVKSRTGVTIQIQGFLFPDQKEKVIYFGQDYDSVFPEAEVKLSGYGCAVLEKDGDIYVFGHDSGSMSTAVTKFFAKIEADCVTENQGLKSLRIPETAYFVYNPGYDIVDAKLLNVPLGQYNIVYSEKSATSYGLAYMLRSIITDKTGCINEIVGDSAAVSEYEILVGDTVRSLSNTLAAGEYRISSEQGRVCIQYGTALAATDALDEFRLVLHKGSETSVNRTGKTENQQCLEKETGTVRIISSNTYFGDYSIPGDIRAGMLAECYQLFDADFIGLQESASKIQYMMKNLNGYGYVTQTTGHTPIIYNTSLWQLAKDNNGAEIKGSFAFDGHCWSAEWIMFQSKNDAAAKVIVMNLHIHPRSDGYKEHRSDDIAVTNAAWKQLLELYPGVPIFTTGDYNTAYKSSDFRSLLAGLEDRMDSGKYLATDSNPDVGLYTYHDYEGTNKAYGGDGIDHIAVTKNLVEVIHYRVIQYAPIGYASDHFPIFIDVKLK